MPTWTHCGTCQALRRPGKEPARILQVSGSSLGSSWQNKTFLFLVKTCHQVLRPLDSHLQPAPLPDSTLLPPRVSLGVGRKNPPADWLSLPGFWLQISLTGGWPHSQGKGVSKSFASARQKAHLIRLRKSVARAVEVEIGLCPNRCWSGPGCIVALFRVVPACSLLTRTFLK